MLKNIKRKFYIFLLILTSSGALFFLAWIIYYSFTHIDLTKTRIAVEMWWQFLSLNLLAFLSLLLIKKIN